jgi:hypothetical protein
MQRKIKVSCDFYYAHRLPLHHIHSTDGLIKACRQKQVSQRDAEAEMQTDVFIPAKTLNLTPLPFKTNETKDELRIIKDLKPHAYLCLT